jgi:hypothetical protein
MTGSPLGPRQQLARLVERLLLYGIEQGLQQTILNPLHFVMIFIRDGDAAHFSVV